MYSPYLNPDAFPCKSNYTWVPTSPPNFGGLNFTSGFSSLIIDRGAFRNYYYVTEKNKNIAVNVFKDNGKEGLEYDPVINATRPLSLPFSVQPSKDNNFVIKNITTQNLIEFDFLLDGSRRLSCIQITYDLSSFNENFVAPETDKNPAILVYGVTQSGAEQLISTDEFKGLRTTRKRVKANETNLTTASEGNISEGGVIFSTAKIKIVNEILDRSKFPQYKKVIFKINPAAINLPTSLVFVIKKIMFFTADRVNFRFNPENNTKQLPCNAIGYSININGKFFPPRTLTSAIFGGGGTFTAGLAANFFGLFPWPGGFSNFSDRATLFVKVFSPDFTTNSPGFAHALQLQILIFSMPFFGPLGDFLLPGIQQPYYGIILGPKAFTTQWVFYGNSNTSERKLAVIPSGQPQIDLGTVQVQQESIFLGGIKEIKDYVSGYEFLLKNPFYYEVEASKQSEFNNFYTDKFSINSISGKYQGALPRKPSVILNAPITSSSQQPATQRTFTYTTYLFKDKPNIFDLFTKTQPCLTFALTDNDYEEFQNTFIQSGFISAGVNCFVEDSTKLFDTKLVYRFYLIKKNGNDGTANPNQDSAITLKIVNAGTIKSDIEGAKVDKNWTFDNTLVTGNILSTQQFIQVTEVINDPGDKLKTFKPFPSTSESFSLYCAVYAMSTLNDNFSAFNLSGFSSLDYPTISFVIKNNFLFELPIYFKKSASRGGTLQAQRELIVQGGYTPDANAYVVITRTYSDLNTGNNLYSGTFSSSTRFNELFLFVPEKSLKPDDNKKFSVEAKVGYSFTDYFLNAETLSKARIAPGAWKLIIELDGVFSKNIETRFDVFAVNSITGNFIYSIVNSVFTPFSANDKNKEGQITNPSLFKTSKTITVPFFLPEDLSSIVIRLYFKNNSKNAQPQTINFNQVKLESNTLEYFNFIAQQVGGYSVGFYEDLPIQPSDTVSGCRDFILKLDAFQQGSGQNGTIIYDPDQGLAINGVIYSPTWVASLPDSLEVRFNGTQINNSRTGTVANGIAPYQIFFRTGVGNPIQSIDTKLYPNNIQAITVFNSPTNTAPNGVKQITASGVSRLVSEQNILSTPDQNLKLSQLNVANPNLSKGSFIVQGQISAQSNINTASLNFSSPTYFAAQPSSSNQVLPLTEDGSISSKMVNCLVSSFDNYQNVNFTLGVTENGNLIFARNEVSTITNNSIFVLAEGDPAYTNTSDELNFYTSLYKGTNQSNQYNYYGPVTTGFPGILATNQQTVVFYIFASTAKISAGATANRQKANIKKETAIYARIISGSIVTDPFLIFDFKSYAEANSNYKMKNAFPPISQISICKLNINEANGEFYLAFICSGKIFVMKGNYKGSTVFLNNLAVIYGNLKTSQSSGISADGLDFNKLLDVLIQNSAVSKIQYSISDQLKASESEPFSKDIEGQQKVGFVDYNGVYMGVQFYVGRSINEILFDKSYGQLGTYRKIGDA
jgi:hypothetical protein